MITVDSKQSELIIANFSNLEEILVKIKEIHISDKFVITDIMVNNEPFTEIYPHQSEDIPSSIIKTIAVKTVSLEQMIADMVDEMYKVVELIKKGSESVSSSLREGEENIGLELLQDLLDVIRDFRSMQSALEISLSGANIAFSANDEQLNELLLEMNDVLSNEDWILLSDILEYEFIPFCNKWKNEVDTLKKSLK